MATQVRLVLATMKAPAQRGPRPRNARRRRGTTARVRGLQPSWPPRFFSVPYVIPANVS